MKHFSRLLALLLAVALLPLTFMAAASAEEPVTITIWGSDRENMPFRNGLWTIDVLQEKLGIKIEIISAPTENGTTLNRPVSISTESSMLTTFVVGFLSCFISPPPNN